MVEIISHVFVAEIQGIKLENQLVLLAIEALLVFVPGIVLQKNGKITYRRLVHIFLLLAYLGIVLSITVFRRAEGSREGIVHLGVILGFGIKTGQPSKWVGTFSAFNVLLFVPLGVLIFFFFREKKALRGVGLTTLIGMMISLAIETTQLITGRGMFEVSDIITNTAGSFIGAFIVWIIAKCRKRK